MRMALAALATAALPALAQAQAQDTSPILETAVHDEYGRYLTSGGRPVYAFITTGVRAGDDQTPLVSCKQKCLDDWPLVTAPGNDVPIGDRVDPELVETLDWEGQNVVVYASRALFYYFRDEPGEGPQGQDVHTYGGWWYLVRPDGSVIVTGIGPEPMGRQEN